MNIKEHSVMGRLISELSWEGKRINRYRDGGRGYENVLTAEVFQALDFLPRAHFWGAIIEEVHLDNRMLKETMISEIEGFNFRLLPSNHYLKPSTNSHQRGMAVQPDAIGETQSTFMILEAKRIKSSSFQEKQLAKEFILATRDARGRIPLLLLVLGKEPPVRVNKMGKMSIGDATSHMLKEIHSETENHPLTYNELVNMIDNHIAWITWDEMRDIVKAQMELLSSDSESTTNSIRRVCDELIRAIERHG